MSKVADLVSPETIKKLAIPSNFRLGASIAKTGNVEFTEFGPLKVSARVSGTGSSSKRTVEMRSDPSGLEFRCTCTKKLNWFCKHCVAVGLLAWEKEMNRKSKG